MTLNVLNEHFAVVDKYNTARTMLQRLRDSTGLKAQAITGMPHGTGVNDTVGAMVVEITHMEERVNELAKLTAESAAPIEAWISGIDDFYTQTIFRLRFLHGMTWQEVADRIGGGNTVQSVQMICYRKISQL